MAKITHGETNPRFLSPPSHHLAIMIYSGSLNNRQVFGDRYLPTDLWERRFYSCLIRDPILGADFPAQRSREVPREAIGHS